PPVLPLVAASLTFARGATRIAGWPRRCLARVALHCRRQPVTMLSPTTQARNASVGASTRNAYDRTFRTPPPDTIRRRWRGCLLGGAVGDALGAPVEFMTL